MKAVFLDRATFSQELVLARPQGLSEYVAYDATPNDHQTIVERCADAQIIITNKVRLDADVIGALPNLRLIQLSATGTDNVDQEACTAHGVQLMNVAGYSASSVPEHTFMLMLALMRTLKHYHRAATDGTWQADGRFCLLDMPMFDLAGKTLGIVGKGVIGQRVGQIATAFGMMVMYAEHQGRVDIRDGYSDFETVLAHSDVISLHCPANTQTQHLINTHTLAKMSKTPLIINVARGAVVHSEAIVQALLTGRILGYGADVFESEPFATNDPLLTIKDHPRVLLTPHNAWGSLAAQSRLWGILCGQVERFVQMQA